MSDYLGNLVARTLGHTPAILPRVGSIFEPSPATAAHAYIEQHAEIVTAPPPSAPAAHFEPAPAVPPQPREQPAAARTSSDEGSQWAVRPQMAQSPDVFPTAPAPVPPPAAQSPAPVPPLAAQLPAPETRRAAPTIVVETIARPQPAPDIPASVRREPPAVAPVSRREEEAPKKTALLREEMPAPQRAGPADRADSPAAPPTVVKHPIAPPRIEPAVSIAHRVPTEPDEVRVIRVTIGRVDVRAMMPAPAAAPRAAEPKRNAPLSLDDYLKRRNEAR